MQNAYLEGLQLGQQSTLHQQQVEANKLKLQVLKHEADQTKLEDALREYSLKQAHAKLLFDAQNGAPAAELPTEDVPTTQPNLPSTSLAGYMTSLYGPQGFAQGDAAASPVPQSVAAPQAQAARPGTNTTTRSMPQGVAFPALPAMVGGGAPGFSRRPVSREDHMRQAIQVKRAEQPLHNVPPGATALQTNIETGAAEPVFANTDLSGKPAEEQLMEAVRRGDVAGAQQILAVMAQAADAKRTGQRDPLVPVQNPDGTVTYQPSSRAAGQTAPNPDRVTRADRDATRDRQEYDDFVRQWNEAEQTHQVDRPGQEDLLPIQRLRERAPYVAPPTLADWLDAGKPGVTGVHQIRANKAKGIPAPRRSAPAPDPTANPLRVTDPNSGRTYEFTTKAKADAFRAALGGGGK